MLLSGKRKTWWLENWFRLGSSQKISLEKWHLSWGLNGKKETTMWTSGGKVSQTTGTTLTWEGLRNRREMHHLERVQWKVREVAPIQNGTKKEGILLLHTKKPGGREGRMLRLVNLATQHPLGPNYSLLSAQPPSRDNFLPAAKMAAKAPTS